MKTLKFPLVKFTFFLVAGILFGFYIKTNIIFTSAALLLVLLVLLMAHKFSKNALFAVTTFFFCVMLGIVTQNAHDIQNDKSHFSRITKKI